MYAIIRAAIKTVDQLISPLKTRGLKADCRIEPLESRRLLSGTPIQLHIPFGGTVSSTPVNLTAVGNSVYFTAKDTSGSIGLFISDGTTAAPIELKSGFIDSPYNVAALGNDLTFVVRDASWHYHLWRSDGTAQGTVQVATFTEILGETGNGTMAVYNGSIYFSADDGTGNGLELWRSDGTAGGTAMVKNIGPGLADSVGYFPTVFNGLLYFQGNDGVHGPELWQTDGTSTGTVLSDDVLSGAGGSYPNRLTVFDGSLYFDAFPDPNSVKLFKSDGTAAGTSAIAVITGGDASPANYNFAAGNTLYFNASDGDGGTELWATDGTSAGVTALGAPQMQNPVNINGELYFQTTTTTGSALWKSDGTAAGTVAIQSFDHPWTGGLVALNGSLFFTQTDSSHGAELWQSDGTTSGTHLFADLLPGEYGSNPSLLTIAGNRLFFAADSTLYGRELWTSDGTAAGTILLDVNQAPASLTVNAPVGLKGSIYFAAPTPSGYQAIWKSDGQSAPTYVTDIGPGGMGSAVTVADQAIYYIDNTNPAQLWKLDASGNKTMMADFGAASNAPFDLTAVGNELMFFAGSSATGIEPWKSDETIAGTLPIANINPGAASSVNSAATSPVIGVWNNQLYFLATDGSAAMVWRTDGTASGTSAFCPAPNGPAVVVNDRIIYIQNGDDGIPATLEMYDGVGSTPTVLTQLGNRNSPYLATPLVITVLRNKALFFTSDTGGPYDLWTSDGTVAGTSDLMHFGFSSEPNAPPLAPVVADNLLYFTMSDVNGFNLWSSDGTASGTTAVTTFGWPPVDVPTNVSNVDESLVYSAGGQMYEIPANKVAPAAPTVAKATVAAADEIDLAWTNNAINETGLVIDRSTSPTFSAIDRTFTAGVGATGIADRVGLVEGATYYYRVRAVNSWGVSAYATAAAAHLPLLPATASNLSSIETVPGRQVQLTWTDNALTTETGEVIQRSITSDFATLGLNVSLPAGQTSYIDNTVSPVTQYYYRVISHNGAGNSGAAVKTITTSDTIPIAPATLTATGVAANEVDLDWTDSSSNETSFVIERADAGGTFNLIATVPAGTISYADTTCTADVQYAYRVSSANGSGTGSSSIATATTLPPELTAPVTALPATGTPDYFVTMGGYAYFVTSGALWKTNGTNAGTSELYAANVHGLVTDGATLFFGIDGGKDQQLWKSDGTISGTVMVKDIVAAGLANLLPLAASSGKCYFWYTDTGTPAVLWASNGTAAGTLEMPDVYVDGGSVFPAYGRAASATFNGEFYFTNEDGPEYQSDGTVAGTKPVPGVPIIDYQDVRSVVVAGGSLYFVGPAANGDRALYKVTTPGGTASVIFDSGAGDITDLTSVGAAVMFFSNGKMYGSSGAASGTSSFATIDSGSSITDVNGTAYFIDDNALYKTDGTTAGTVRIRAYAPQTYPDHIPVFMTAVGSEVFYSDGIYLWRSDGTNAGTVKVEQITNDDDVTDVPEGFYAGNPDIALGNQLLFSADLPGTDQPNGARQVETAWSTAPAAPSSLSVSATAGGSAGVSAMAMTTRSAAVVSTNNQITWVNHAINASGLVIDRSTFSNFSTIQQSFFVSSTTTSFTDATAVAGVTYYYRIRAVNAGGNSAFVYVGPPAGSISGTVFNDANHDGIQDNGETGIAGVRVYQDPNYNHAWDSTKEQSALTDASGNFVFTNPPADPEILRIILPGGTQQTFPASNVGQYVGKYTGQTLADENFGIYTPVAGVGTITGSAFNDLNGDHAQTSNEPNLAGVTVFLDLNNDGKFTTGEPTAVTNSSGNFTFTGLKAGSYIVCVLPGAGFRQTFPVTGGTKVTVISNGTVSAGKLGVTNTAYVGGNLFNDLNGNGAQNSGEALLSGYKVFIDLNHDGIFESTEATSVTSSGYWYFRSVAPGTYVIRVATPAGWTTTHAYPVTLASGQTVTNGLLGIKKG